MWSLHRTIVGTSILFLLGGCLPTDQRVPENDLMENPLYAKRYYDELAENLVSLSIHKNPLLQEKGKEKTVEHVRREALVQGRKTEQELLSGTKGAFIPMEEYAQGIAFLDSHALYLSSDFEVTPGISLHLFLTTAVDPRDTLFPDPNAIDLGPLKSAYGAQSFAANLPANPILFRTAVLWDTALERLVSFAQLSE